MRRESVARLIARIATILLAELGTVVVTTGIVLAQQPAPSSKPVAIRVADSTQVQVMRLRDGSSIVGRVTEIGPDTVRFVAKAGALSIARADIVEVREVATSALRSGEVWPANPNATRLLFAPTGRMLEKGEGYFNDTYLFLVSVHGGITSRFSLGGGMSVLPLDNFTDNALYIMPKVGVYASPKLNVAVGGLAGIVGGLVDDDVNATFGIVYAVGTAGSADASVSFGTGLAYAGGQFADRPVAMIGAEKRMSRRVSFVTENYLVPNDGVNAVISYGLRFFGEKLSADLAFWNAPGNNIPFPGIPYVAFSVKF
jgi:hypothetical protein